jgi:hypothetical protein
MIIWKGWGFLSVVIAAAFFFAFGYLGHLIIGESPHRNGVQYGAAVGLVIAAVVNWFVGRSLNRGNRTAGANVFSRHSLFFVSMEYWSIAMVLGSITFLLSARE